MPAGDLARHGREVGVREDLRHEAQVLADEYGAPVAHGYARGLLAAVLQGAQREVRDARHVAPGGPDAKDAALLVEPLCLACGAGFDLCQGRTPYSLVVAASADAPADLGTQTSSVRPESPLS